MRKSRLQAKRKDGVSVSGSLELAVGKRMEKSEPLQMYSAHLLESSSLGAKRPVPNSPPRLILFPHFGEEAGSEGDSGVVGDWTEARMGDWEEEKGAERR